MSVCRGTHRLSPTHPVRGAMLTLDPTQPYSKVFAVAREFLCLGLTSAWRWANNEYGEHEAYEIMDRLLPESAFLVVKQESDLTGALKQESEQSFDDLRGLVAKRIGEYASSRDASSELAHFAQCVGQAADDMMRASLTGSMHAGGFLKTIDPAKYLNR